MVGVGMGSRCMDVGGRCVSGSRCVGGFGCVL